MRLNEISGEIPPTSYGYWITPEGDFVPTNFQAHQMVLNRIFPPLVDGYKFQSTAAFMQGYISVGWLHGEFFIRMHLGTVASRNALIRLIREFPRDVTIYHIDSHINDHEEFSGTFPGSGESKDVIRYIRSQF